MTFAVLPESIRVKTKGAFVIRDPKGPSPVQLASTLTLTNCPFAALTLTNAARHNARANTRTTWFFAEDGGYS